MSTESSTQPTASVIAVPPVPARYSVTPQVVFLLHCSHCGNPAQGEYGELRLPAEVFEDPTRYALDEEAGFRLGVDGRPAVCGTCYGERLCEECPDEIHAWTPYKVDRSDDTRAHVDCAAGKPEWVSAELMVPPVAGLRVPS